MSYRITWEQHGVYRVFTDRTDGAEILKSVKAVHGDARFDEIRYVINDFTACQEIVIDDASSKEISAIDLAASLTNPRIKVAVIGGSEALTQGVKEYIEAGLSPYPTRLFSNVSDARRWIDPGFEAA